MKELIAFGVAFATLAVGAARAEPLKIRADWSATPAQTAPLMPLVPKYAPGLLRHWGKSYVVEPLFMAGGGTSLTALAAGETDLNGLTPQSLTLAVLEAKLDVRVLAQQVSSEVDGRQGTFFWVRADEITRLEDLKGKTIGINSRASVVDATARIVLGRVGLKEGTDYQFVEVRFPAQLAALESRRVDAAVLIAPFNYLAEKKPGLKPMFSIGNAFGSMETNLWGARSDWIAANRAALVDFLEDNFRVRRWLFDPKTRPDAIRLVAELTKRPAEDFADWVYTKRDYYIDPNGVVDLARLQKNVDDLRSAGLLKDTIKVASHVDLSLAKEAAARIRD